MGASASIAIDLELRDAALAAASWLPAFYPRVRVTVGNDTIDLFSDHHSENDLAAIWAAALANDVLLSRARAFRASAFEELAR